jgi:hypothetical protein
MNMSENTWDTSRLQRASLTIMFRRPNPLSHFAVLHDTRCMQLSKGFRSGGSLRPISSTLSRKALTVLTNGILKRWHMVFTSSSPCPVTKSAGQLSLSSTVNVFRMSSFDSARPLAVEQSHRDLMLLIKHVRNCLFTLNVMASNAIRFLRR